MNIVNKNTTIRAISKRLWIIGCTAMLTGLVAAGISDAGITRNSFIGGRIDRFGSIFVNNREITIAGAVITVDGQPSSQADLAIGQVVSVRGAFDTELPIGVADEVIFEGNVEGPISSIDYDAGELVVLGQSVHADFETVVALLSGSNDFDDLQVNDVVEISGFLTADSTRLASLIQQKPAGGEHEVTGTVSDLAVDSFSIHSLRVNTVGVTPVGFPGGSISDGDVVEVKGSAFNAQGEFQASQVEFKPPLVRANGEFGDFEGLITDFENAASFIIDDVPVATDGMTVFVGGGPANLTGNTSIEVTGTFDNDGTLVADRVLIHGTRIRIHGAVDAAAANSVTVLGVTASIDAATNLSDESSAKMKPLVPTDIHAGDYLEIRSFRDPSVITPFLAERVKRTDGDNDVRVQGFVTSVASTTLDVLGVSVHVNSHTDYFDAADKKITATDFFSRVNAGSFVVVNGAEVTTTGIQAEEISLTLDD